MKIIKLFLFIIILFFACNNPDSIAQKRPLANLEATYSKATEALKYCKSKNFNTDFCILMDMSLHSGINRFFVWDFKKKKV